MIPSPLPRVIFLSFFITVSAGATTGTNEWTKPTSGYWEEPYWSLGELPSIAHSLVAFRNPGFKALAIGANTTANYSNSLSIRNLLVDDPANLLLMNYAGLQVPLTVAEEFTLGPAASLLSYYSALSVSNFLASGRVIFSEGSVANFNTFRLGVSAPAELNISNAVITVQALRVGDTAPGTVNQFSGTHRVGGSNGAGALWMGPFPANYNLRNGVLLVSSVAQFYSSESAFVVSGGSMDVDGSGMTVGSGSFLLEGGSLRVRQNVGIDERFMQTGGTNVIEGLLSMPAASFRYATNLLSGGTFLSSNIVLGATFGGHGTFEQTGGMHNNHGQIEILGDEGHQTHTPRGSYNLAGGLLTAEKINIIGGALEQTGGTNRVNDVFLDAYGSYTMAGGSLYSSNVTLSADLGGLPYFWSTAFVQSDGTHTIQNKLIIKPGTDWRFPRGGVYWLSGGTLRSQFADVYGFGQTGGVHTNGQILMVHGAYRLEGGTIISPYLYIDGTAYFTHTAGSNRAELLYMDVNTVYDFRGGTLSTSNSTISSAYAANRGSRPRFLHTDGNHVVQNTLTVDATYWMRGGSLTASNITLTPDGDLLMDAGTINNPGLFTMYDGICRANGQHLNLGKLDIRIGILSRFDQPLITTLDLQTGSTILRFRPSADLSSQWNGKLSITNWSGFTNGGGTDQIYVGTTAQGLTAAQLAGILFDNPAGLPPGKYPARILASGEIVPATRPSITFSRSSSRLVLSWNSNYELRTATNVAGPYITIPGATSPYTNLFNGPQRYFELRSPGYWP